MNEQEFQNKLKEQANAYLNEGRSTEEVQTWIDRQKELYAAKQAEEAEKPEPEEVDPQIDPKATDFHGTEEDQIYESGEKIGLTKDDVIPKWIQGSDFLEGAYFTIAKQFPHAFTGAATAIAAKDMQRDQGELASLKERLANSENPEAEVYTHFNQAVGFGSAGPGARPTLQEVPLSQRIEQLENKIRTDKAGIVKNLFEMKGLTEEMAVFDNPEIFDEDGMTLDDFQGMVGRQVPQMAMSALTAGMGAFGQEFGSAYADNLDAIAREKYGLSPEQDPTEAQLMEIIENGEDEQAVALATGAVSGSLEFVGANQAVGAFFKSGAVKGVLRGQAKKVLKEGGRQALKNGLTEGFTELSQGITQDVGRGIASGTEIELDPQQMIEEGAQGAVIGALFGGAGGVRSQRAANARARAEGGYRQIENPDGTTTNVGSQEVDNAMPQDQKDANAEDNAIVAEQNLREKQAIEDGEQDIDTIVQEAQEVAPQEQAQEEQVAPDEERVLEVTNEEDGSTDKYAQEDGGYWVSSATAAAAPVYNAAQQVRNEAQDRIKDRTAVNQDIILSMPQGGLNNYFTNNNTIAQIDEQVADANTSDVMREKLEAKKKDLQAQNKAMYDATANAVTNFTALVNTVKDQVKLPTIESGIREQVQEEVTAAQDKLKNELNKMSNPETPPTATFVREQEKGNIGVEINQTPEGPVATYTPITDAWYQTQKADPTQMIAEDFGDRVRLGPKISSGIVDTTGVTEADIAAAQAEVARVEANPASVGSPFTPAEVATEGLAEAERTSVSRRAQKDALEFTKMKETPQGKIPMFRDPKTGLEIPGKLVPKDQIYSNYASAINDELGYSIPADRAAQRKLQVAMDQAESIDVADNIEATVPGAKKAMQDLRNIRSTLKAAAAAQQISQETAGNLTPAQVQEIGGRRLAKVQISDQHRAISAKIPAYKTAEDLIKRVGALQDQIAGAKSEGQTVDTQGAAQQGVDQEQVAALEADLDATINELAEAINALPNDVNLPDISADTFMFEDVNKRNAQRSNAIKKRLAEIPVNKKNAPEIARLKRRLKLLNQTSAGNIQSAFNRDIANSGLATKLTKKMADDFVAGKITPEEMAAKLVKYANGLSFGKNSSILNGDMTQEAQIAMLEALQNFKAKKVVKGDKFTSHENQIKSAIKNRVEFRLRDMRNQLKAMPISKQARSLKQKIFAVENAFFAKNQRVPTDAEIATMLNEGIQVLQEKDIKETKEGKEVQKRGGFKTIAKEAKQKDLTEEDVRDVRAEIFKAQSLQNDNVIPTEDGDVDILETIADTKSDIFEGKSFSNAIMKPADIKSISKAAQTVGYPSAVFQFLKTNGIKLSDYAVELATVGYGKHYAPFSRGDFFGKADKNEITAEEIYNEADKIFDRMADLALPDAYKQFLAPGVKANPLKYLVDKMAYEIELNDIKNRKFNGPTDRQVADEFVSASWQDVGSNGVSEAINGISSFLEEAIPGTTFQMSNQGFVNDVAANKIKPAMRGYDVNSESQRRAWAEKMVGRLAGMKLGGYVFVNENTTMPDAPLHEATHIWWSFLEKADGNGSLRRAMYDKLRNEAPDIFNEQYNRVKNSYRFAPDSPKFIEEVIVGATGAAGTDMILEHKSQANTWKQAIMSLLKKALGAMGLDFRGKNLEDITVSEMFEAITTDVLQGKGGKQSKLFELKNVRRRWSLFEGWYADVQPAKTREEISALYKKDPVKASNVATQKITGRNVKGALDKNIEATYYNNGVEAQNVDKMKKAIGKLLNFNFKYKGDAYKKSMVDSATRNYMDIVRRNFAENNQNMSYQDLNTLLVNLSNNIKQSMEQTREARAGRSFTYKGIETNATDFIQNVAGVDLNIAKDDVQAYGEENTGFISRLRQRGPLGVIADAIAPSSNDDFYGLMYRILPKKNRAAAKQFMNNALFQPLETANFEYAKYKGAAMESWNGLKEKFPEVAETLGDKSGLKKGRMDLTNSQVVMLYNYMKDPRNHKQMKKGGVTPELMKQVIEYVQGNNDLNAFSDGIPGIFQGFKGQLDATLDRHNIATSLEHVISKEGSSLADKDIMKALYGDKYGTTEITVPYTPFFASADEALDLDEKAFKGEDGKTFYSVMSGRLKERNFGGELKMNGNDLETMMNSYMGGPLRTMAYLDFAKNANAFFSPTNMKLSEATLGNAWKSATQDSLRRIITGTHNRTAQPSEISSVEKWLNRTVSGIMFVNPRSAMLQMVSVTNFMGDDFGAYAKAAANPAASLSALKMIWNSDFIKQRGEGKIDVVMSELFNQRGNNAVTRAIDYMLEKGYFLTKGADRLAIALGGAPYLAAELKKNGGNVEAAMTKFIAKANEAQQSTNPERLGQIQTTKTGRYVLAFTNATQQFNRIMAKSLRDIQAGQDVGRNMRKIMNYAGVQIAGFAFLQKSMQSLLMRGADEEEETDKWIGYLSGLFDTVASSAGLLGTAVATATNIAIQFARNHDDPRIAEKLEREILNIIPAVGTKIRSFRNAVKGRYFKQSNGPVDVSDEIVRTASAIQFATGIPAERVVRLFEQMNDMGASDLDILQKLARLAGWSRYDLGVEGVKQKDEFDQGFDSGFEDTSFDSPNFKRSPLAKVTKVVEDEKEPGVLGRADKDGTVHLKPGLPAPLKEQVMKHEGKHAEQMKSGKLDYTDKYLVWNGKKYDRKGGKIYYNGKWIQEGSDKFPWEQEAEAAEGKSPLHKTDKKKKKKKKEVSHHLYAPGYTKHFMKGEGVSKYHKGLLGSEGGQGGLLYSQHRKKPGKKGGTTYTAGVMQNSYGDPLVAGTVGREWDLGKGWKAGVHGGATHGYQKSFRDQEKAANAQGRSLREDPVNKFGQDNSLMPIATGTIEKQFGNSGLGAKAIVNPMYINLGLSYKFKKRKKKK